MVATERKLLLAGVAAALIVGLLIGFVVGSRSDSFDPQRNPIQQPSSDEEVGSDEQNGPSAGYSRTEEGAVAAAADFHLLSGRHDLDLEAMTKAMTMLAAPSWRSDAKAQAKTGHEYVVNTYGDDARVRSAVLSHRVASFTETNAVVELWTVTVLSGNRRPNAEQVWGIVTVKLAWVGEDWRIEGIESSPGASPVDISSGHSDPTAAEVMEEFDAFDEAAVP